MNLKISAERGDGMLNYLEQGMILYVMAAVCVIGVIRDLQQTVVTKV